MQRVNRLLCLAVLTLMVLGAAMPSMAAEATGATTASADRPNLRAAATDPTGTRPDFPPPPPHPPLDPRVQYVTGVGCDIFGPAEVQGYRVQCPGGTFLDFYASDGFIPGDHWELKGKNWDLFPNTGVTTSPGPVILYGVPGRVYTYGANPLDAYIECTYIHGVNIFPASGFILLATDAPGCTVTLDPIRSRINRAP